MRGCGCALVIVLPFWVGVYLLVGWSGVAWMAAACGAVELVLFRDDWLGLLRRGAS